MAFENPVILIVHKDHTISSHWKRQLEEHIRKKGAIPDIREATSNEMAKTRLNEILGENKRPNLIVTDFDGGNGADIATNLKRGLFLPDQDWKFPAGRQLPVIIGGDKALLEKDYVESTSQTLYIPTNLLSHLSDPTYQGYGASFGPKFNDFVDAALQTKPREAVPIARI